MDDKRIRLLIETPAGSSIDLQFDSEKDLRDGVGALHKLLCCVGVDKAIYMVGDQTVKRASGQ